MPRPLAGCSETLKRSNETLQRFRIYALSYEALQCFIEVLSNLTHPDVLTYTHTHSLAVLSSSLYFRMIWVSRYLLSNYYGFCWRSGYRLKDVLTVCSYSCEDANTSMKSPSSLTGQLSLLSPNLQCQCTEGISKRNNRKRC